MVEKKDNAIMKSNIFEFKKFDKDKPKWSLFPWRAAMKVMKVIHHGGAKYGWNNWRTAKLDEDRRRYLDATFRHLIAHANTETHDKESGFPHLWNAACSLLFYLEYDSCVELEEKNDG